MKHKLVICLIMTLSCFLPACDLGLEPEDGVTRDKFWQNKEEVRDAVMGCYAAMMQSANMERFFTWGELRADLVKSSARGLNTMFYQVQNGDITSTMKYCNWSSLYSVINNCNTVLEFAKETQKIDQSFTPALLAEYEAEAKCIRALMYFYLVRTFRDVPLITAPSLNDDQDYRIPKSSGDDILNFLIAELKSVDRAENGTNTGIPFTYGTSARENKGRFTVWSLKALLADIYLWKGDYANCVSQCKQIITSGQFALVPIQRTEAEVEDIFGNKYTVYYPSESDADNLFLSMYAQGNSVESILELQFGTDFENPFRSLFNPSSGSLAANTEQLSTLGMFTPSNLDRGWYDVRGEGVDYRQGLVWKWIGLSRNEYTYRAEGQSFSNWIFYRLADVVLMQAEALNQQGKQSGDIEKLRESWNLVKTIRDRACAPESTDLIPDERNLDAATLGQFILDERAKEFAHEGKRWFDVLRNAKRDNYAGIGYLEVLSVYAATPDKAVSLQNKWVGDYNSHYLPIFEDEMRNNTALVQNPFYEK